MTNLDAEVAEVQLAEDFMDDLQTLGIWYHVVVLARNVEILKHTNSVGAQIISQPMEVCSQLLKKSKRQRTQPAGVKTCLEVTHALVKLSVASASHGWVITTVHLGNVVALNVGDLVHGQVSSKGHLTEGRSRTTRASPKRCEQHLKTKAPHKNSMFHQKNCC